MELVIPVFFEKPVSISISKTSQNPGIGGTEFTSLKLALLLTSKFPDIKIFLVHNGKVNLVDKTANLNLVKCSFKVGWLESLLSGQKKKIFLLTASIAQKIDKDVLSRNSRNIILWFRHPFQFDLKLRKIKASASVHVGSYQFFSNSSFYKNSCFIPNIFIPSAKGKVKYLPSNSIKLVYVGALVQPKGFHLIAKQWKELKKVHRNLTLDVIGSSETHGIPTTHPILPCEADFGDKILKYLPMKDIESSKVRFHGNLGPEKFAILKKCDIAVLNPTGSSEAYPATPLECMAVGLPVISSSDYGMKDSMRFFPELNIKQTGEIPEKITWLLNNRQRYSELSSRSLLVANWFGSQTDVILERWNLLINTFSINSEEPNISKHLIPFGFEKEGGVVFRMRQIRAVSGELKRALAKNLS